MIKNRTLSDNLKIVRMPDAVLLGIPQIARRIAWDPPPW